MPFFLSNSNFKIIVSLALSVAFFQACSSAEKVSEKNSEVDAKPVVSFDPTWYNKLEPNSIDSVQISSSAFVQATMVTFATDIAKNEAKKLLSKYTDDYVEGLRKANDTQEWNASRLIALRRFVNSYVYENAKVLNETSAETKLGFYAWMQLGIDRVAFDKELNEGFGL